MGSAESGRQVSRKALAVRIRGVAKASLWKCLSPVRITSTAAVIAASRIVAGHSGRRWSVRSAQAGPIRTRFPMRNASSAGGRSGRFSLTMRWGSLSTHCVRTSTCSSRTRERACAGTEVGNSREEMTTFVSTRTRVVQRALACCRRAPGRHLHRPRRSQHSHRRTPPAPERGQRAQPWRRRPHRSASPRTAPCHPA